MMLPAIMKHLNITAHESLLFLVLPTMKLNLSFLSQPDILILTPDVSLKQKLESRVDIKYGYVRMYFKRWIIYQVRDGNIRLFHWAPKRVQPPIGVTLTIILTMEWEPTAMPHLGELSLTLVHRQMETPLGIMRSIPWILAWDTAIMHCNIITTG